LSHWAKIGIPAREVTGGRVGGNSKIWTAAVVVIGDEILSGRTQDSNVARLATWLNEQGIRLAEVRIVPDDVERIGEAVNALRTRHDYLFTTGGIGPTHDDITVDAIAAAFGVPVIVHPEARQILEDYYRGRPGGLTEARLRMARVPQGAELLRNPSSGAPGIKMGNVYILAGVPGIAASMMYALTGTLAGGRPVVSVTVGARAAESDVADLLRETEAAHPGVAIGSYPFFKDGGYGANFVIRSEDAELARVTGDDLAERLRAAGYEPAEGGI
jgi:molybdenum cofactor synthesis domain-containing protein